MSCVHMPATISHKRYSHNSQSDVFLYHTCDMGTFSERLREARKEAGLSQKELAEKGGLSQTTISDIERGRNAGSTEAPLLAEILKVEALWLTDGRGQKSRSQTIQKQPVEPVEPGDNRLPIRRALCPLPRKRHDKRVPVGAFGKNRNSDR